MGCHFLLLGANGSNLHPQGVDHILFLSHHHLSLEYPELSVFFHQIILSSRYPSCNLMSEKTHSSNNSSHSSLDFKILGNVETSLLMDFIVGIVGRCVDSPMFNCLLLLPFLVGFFRRTSGFPNFLFGFFRLTSGFVNFLLLLLAGFRWDIGFVG